MILDERKVLLVDDEVSILNTFKAGLLRQFNFETALGPEEGLHKVELEGPYAVIISDLKMPLMDGFSFLEAAGRLSPESVLMILTGNADMDAAIKALNDGAVFRFLTKPCTPSQLIQAVEAGLKQHALQKAQSTIEELKQYADTVLHLIPTGVVIIDAETHTIMDINKAAAQMIGEHWEDIPGQKCFDLVCHAKEGQCPIAETETPDLNEVRTLPSGLVVQKSIATMTRAGRKYYLETFVDISELIKAKTQLARALNDANKDDHAKLMFISRMSHELRTPLNSIIGFSDLLLKPDSSSLSPTQMGQIKHIKKSGIHLLDMVNDILDFSIMDSESMNFVMRPVSVKETVETCISIISSLARTKVVEVLDKTPEDLPPVFVDAIRFKQIVLNLLSNAVKYNREKGSVTITARAHNGQVIIRVKDTGIGIPTKKKAELFKPFSRLSADSREIEGAGIGLSLVKQMVEAMDGLISFVSTEGHGSTFFVYLPIDKNGLENNGHAESILNKTEVVQKEIPKENISPDSSGGKQNVSSATVNELQSALADIIESLNKADPLKCREKSLSIKKLNWPQALIPEMNLLITAIGGYDYRKAAEIARAMEASLIEMQTEDL
ncbi:ATP-binding protein [Desulfovibrio sp. JC010]|uniref:ATP-binding protein n=1 Tax=Desulfovibrio sp. JC010 TaxID=2593641 RepID=UPI0013D4B5B2|nr:ATP-binding protein [Desulfovibrio sp. JC010]